jgi:hypothetical protein
MGLVVVGWWLYKSIETSRDIAIKKINLNKLFGESQFESCKVVVWYQSMMALNL